MKHFMIIAVWIAACASQNEPPKTLDIQGHRGARGLFPENSLPGFIHAANLGVTTLELDIVVSRDSQLVVSHEPFFSPHICLDQRGDTLSSDTVINMYHLNYDQIRLFDCGSIGNVRFPEQRKMTVYKPLLSEVIDSLEARGFSEIRYNIELKTRSETDDLFHPSPIVFSDLVMNLLQSKGLMNRATIQSFDFRTLQYLHTTYPGLPLALLTDQKKPWTKHIDSLGFIPTIYSPHYPLLSQQVIQELQQLGVQVIPWTVNDPAEIKKMIDWRVDGVITDYPDLAVKLIRQKR